MSERPFWWRIFHHNLTGRLLLIIIFLTLTTIGNVLGIYKAIVSHDETALASSALSVLLYAIPTLGLIRLRPWGRLLELIISILVTAIFGPILILFNKDIFSGILIVCIHGYITKYLLSAECKKLFSIPTQRN